MVKRAVFRYLRTIFWKRDVRRLARKWTIPRHASQKRSKILDEERSSLQRKGHRSIVLTTNKHTYSETVLNTVRNVLFCLSLSGVCYELKATDPNWSRGCYVALVTSAGPTTLNIYSKPKTIEILPPSWPYHYSPEYKFIKVLSLPKVCQLW